MVLFHLFAAVIYFPAIVASMIMSQIYFERFWTSYNNSSPSKRWLLSPAIVVSYLMQEFCLIQLSVLNLQEVSFTLVVPITMIFRERKYKIWWWLLGITPLFVALVETYTRWWPLNYWAYGILESIIFLAICWFLTKWHSPHQRVRYYMALACLAVFEVATLMFMHRVTFVHIVSATVGLLVIALIEERRHVSEAYNIRKLKTLRRDSERDDLTGLLNYRALNREVSLLEHRDNFKSVVIGALDIDHFKRVNDTYGHFVGNEVLNYFSTIFMNRIHTAFPNQGYVYRFGGEEFSIVVANHSLQEVYDVVQSLEDYFGHTTIVTKEKLKIKISFSCSLTVRNSDEPLEQTLKRADKMLYGVKNNGRGWIVTDQHGKQRFK
ncbi:GGDEF domain-containing protein [Limosilactobacillus difficilis]|uniref:GGDEF domain-containing protein n=1 Tax=Limosilactobacillus difficilis TaxID=2991838 RepID=UPI0024BB49ED|nr:GGDEF domain-containing protein [Limosilactobacillus difficilis]